MDDYYYYYYYYWLLVIGYLRLCQVFSNSQSTVCESNTFWEVASGKYWNECI